MDDSFFRIPISDDARNAIAVDGNNLYATPSEHVQLDRLGIDKKKRRSVDCSEHSSFMREQLDLRSEFHSRNQTMTTYSDALVATFMGSRSDFQENLDSTTVSAASSYPSEGFSTYHPSDCSNSLKSSFVCATGHECDEIFGNIYGEGDHQYVPARASFQLCSNSRNIEAGGWISGNGNASIDDHYDSRRFTNELALSLATSQHSIIDSASIPDQCSEILGKETRLSSEQTSSQTRERGLRTILHGHGQIFQASAGSRFLEVIQEILTQIASYSPESLNQPNYSAWGTKAGPNGLFFSGYHLEGGPLPGSNEPPNVDGGIHIEMDPALERRALEAKKRQLLALLEVVDERYNQCLDDIHTVVSAFHAATELDPQLHTRFALQATTSLYKGLKERISNQILAIGAHSKSSSFRKILAYSETSYLQNQWSLHQLKRKDHQLWRPQRGLPERSVLVLRAWMFENFLHPYPKDSEKHLLSIKSGLTRSQVSNWFINARVRLWKPMIEAMYAEINKRKSLQKGEGANTSRGAHITLSSSHFNTNRN